jgi:hypothetical protein
MVRATWLSSIGVSVLMLLLESRDRIRGTGHFRVGCSMQNSFEYRILGVYSLEIERQM